MRKRRRRVLDVTAEAGPGSSPPGPSAAIADFDNDDFRDLLLTTTDGVRLYRNTGTGTFADVTKQAGMDTLGGVYLAAGWIDIDQDCDVDLVVCRLADTVAGAAKTLSGRPAAGGRVDCSSIGETRRRCPKVGGSRRSRSPSSGRKGCRVFRRGAVTGLLFTDLDWDKDVDIILLREGQQPLSVENDRSAPLRTVRRFPGRRRFLERWGGRELQHDSRSDILLVPLNKPPEVLLSKSGYREGRVDAWFDKAATNSPPLRHATGVDLDADGWTDVVGLAADGTLTFLHNDGQNRLVNLTAALGVSIAEPLVAVAAADLGDQCRPDLVLWTEAKGLVVLRSSDNGNKTVRLDLTGRYEIDRSRTNADGSAARSKLAPAKSSPASKTQR